MRTCWTTQSAFIYASSLRLARYVVFQA